MLIWKLLSLSHPLTSFYWFRFGVSDSLWSFYLPSFAKFLNSSIAEFFLKGDNQIRWSQSSDNVLVLFSFSSLSIQSLRVAVRRGPNDFSFLFLLLFFTPSAKSILFSFLDICSFFLNMFLLSFYFFPSFFLTFLSFFVFLP